MGEKSGTILLVIAALIIGIFVFVKGMVPVVETKGDAIETQITTTNIADPL